MSTEHKDLLATQRLSQRFSSRLCHGDRIYSSAYYWKKQMDTIQHCVYMENDDGEPRYGFIVAFGFDSWTSECCVLLEELTIGNPFSDLSEALRNSDHEVKNRARSALYKVVDNNRYFKSVLGRKLVVCNAYQIRSPAILIRDSDFCFVSRI